MKRTSGRYRGSRRRSGGILIPVLVVLCIIAAGALYVVNNNMIFTREGSFVIPKKEEKTPGKVEANLVIDEEEVPEVEETISVQTPQESANTKDERSMFVPIGSVKNTELFMAELTLAAQRGIKTLVLEVKASDGTLAFATETKIGNSTLLAGDNAIFAENIKLAREAGYSVSFYLSCFKDNEAARRNQEYSVRTKNKVIWLDGENVRWLSAYSESARGYIRDLVDELLAFSPDEFILSNISFPAYGKTELIEYPDGGREKSDQLRTFIEEMREATGDVPLSAVYENYSGAYLEKSGQKAEDFETFDKLYISREGGKISAPIEDAPVSHKKIIPIEREVTNGSFLLK